VVETHEGCVLAVVGSRDVPDYQSASLVKQAILEHKPRLVISGGAKGVDTVGVKTARELGIATMEILPTHKTWDQPETGEPQETATEYGLVVAVSGGFKQRNTHIAEICECLVRVASASTSTYGSGWTADYAERLGRRVVRYTV
jgi:predicted Rossmann fold nucleotide-binding protein DprA/Smf involved in DNA uptake